ncbi:hypothetical protein ACAF76_000160 [Brevibacillus sp. TJ4]|uniref:hypothetical protein n=1 Tax=Brevibacillus sp. TJ4 TaxID=3234853 RepID=UPI0037D7DD41
MAYVDTVEYVVHLMLRAGVSPAKIVSVSRDLSTLFGVSSAEEAELLVRDCLYQYEKKSQA